MKRVKSEESSDRESRKLGKNRWGKNLVPIKFKDWKPANSETREVKNSV